MEDFSSFGLKAPLLKAILGMGYTAPTPIQAQTIPMLLEEPTDFLGLAATGTGKTAAFSIPLLNQIDPEIKMVQGLILCPTRELAVQVAGQVTLLGKYMGIKAAAVYGGASYADQLQALKHGAQIVVGTPGRVVDHITRGSLKLPQVKVMILDEADEMISMGFKEEMEEILTSLPEGTANTWLFSATMSPLVAKVAKTYLKDPKSVHASRGEMVPTKVEQIYYAVRESDKPEILCKLIEAAEDFYGLVFCQTKALVQELTMFLQERGYKVDSLHGDKDQTARERTLHAFRERRVSILICTDVASRGIDVKDISHVVNYSLPRELDNYVHRIGRTARSGKTGIAMNLVTASHRRLIFAIEQMTKTRMVEGRIPSRKEIGQKKVTAILPKFMAQPFFDRAMGLLGEEWKAALADMSTEQVAAHFLTMMMPDLFNEKDKEPMQRDERSERGDDRRPRHNSDRREARGGGGYGGGGYRGHDRGGQGGGGYGGGSSGYRGGGNDRGPRTPRFDRPRHDGPRAEGPAISGGDRPPRFGGRASGSVDGANRPARTFAAEGGGARPVRTFAADASKSKAREGAEGEAPSKPRKNKYPARPRD